MKKILSVIALSFMLLLTACAAVPPRPATPTPAKETYKIEFINETTNFAFAIVCIVPLPANENTKCLMDPFAVYPPMLNKKHGDLVPTRATIHLEPGEYAYLLIAIDLRTQKQERSQAQFVLEGDGQVIFRERGMSVSIYGKNLGLDGKRCSKTY